MYSLEKPPGDPLELTFHVSVPRRLGLTVHSTLNQEVGFKYNEPNYLCKRWR